MKRIKVKSVSDAKYKPGTIYTFILAGSLHWQNNSYCLIAIMDAIKVKKVRYNILVVQNTSHIFRSHIIDLTETKLEEYYFNERIWKKLSEKDLKFLVKFGNTPTGIVYDILNSDNFTKRMEREVILAETKLKKVKHRAEAIKKMQARFKEEYGA